MRSFLRLIVGSSASAALALTAVAGPEPIPRESKDVSKEVASVAPPPCDWQGFYIGLHGGGVFGDGEATDVDEYNADSFEDHDWSYDVSGFIGGLQVGYNLQPLRRLVLGLEADAGYLGLEGSGTQPESPGGDTFGESNGGFYTTLRGRVGVAFDCFLLYITGGGIGSNFEARVEDDCLTGDCGPALGSGSSSEFRLGWTAGGGGEYLFNRRWSVKVEYLYFDLEDDSLEFHTRDGTPFTFDTETDGHIVRGGINFHF